jgi:hypothetical protein
LPSCKCKIRFRFNVLTYDRNSQFDDGGVVLKPWAEIADIAEAIMIRLCPPSNKIIRTDTRGMAAGPDRIAVYIMRSVGHC